MRPARLVLAVAGLAMVAFGVVSAVGSLDFAAFRHSLFLIAVLVGHDLLLMPVVIGVGVLVGRLVPGRYRGVVQACLIVTATLSVVALPLLLGFGRRPDVASVLARNYPGGYAIVLGAVWLIAVLVIGGRRLVSARRSARARRRAPAGRG